MLRPALPAADRRPLMMDRLMSCPRLCRLTFSHVMPSDASGGCTGYRMMMSIMAGNTANDRALDATGSLAGSWGDDQRGSKNG